MKKLFIQAVKFFGISGMGWIFDFCIYTMLRFLSQNLTLNNIISSWVGATFVFIFATRKVFRNNSKIPLKAKYVLYILYQCVLIYIISRLLGIINGVIVSNTDIVFIKSLSFIISKIIITPITMFLNFTIMKFIIEKIWYIKKP